MSQPTLTATLQKIKQMEAELIIELKKAISAHMTVWQGIPFLAWQVAQKPHEWGGYYPACMYGLWPVCLESNGWYADIFIDCATGEILYGRGDLRDAVPDQMFHKMLSQLHKVDPFLISDELRRTAGRSYGEARNIWVIELQKHEVVPNLFVRKKDLPQKVDNQLVDST